jgi:hypothetical protein
MSCALFLIRTQIFWYVSECVTALIVHCMTSSFRSIKCCKYASKIWVPTAHSAHSAKRLRRVLRSMFGPHSIFRYVSEPVTTLLVHGMTSLFRFNDCSKDTQFSYAITILHLARFTNHTVRKEYPNIAKFTVVWYLAKLTS